MPTHPVVIHRDAAYPAPGLEGDELVGFPVAFMHDAGVALAARYVCTAAFNQVRNNALGIHAAHDYAPQAGETRELVIVAQAAGRPLLYYPWNGVVGPGGGYGNALLIEHADTELSLYAHLLRFVGRVAAWIEGGALPEDAPWLEEGEPIGVMGNRGNVWGWRPDGTLGPPLGPDDLVTGVHLHFERRARAELQNVLIDPEVRFEVVSDLPSVPQLPSPGLPPANPEPNTPIELGPVQALAEARLLYRLAVDLRDHPQPVDDPYLAAITALRREGQEMVAAFGAYTGARQEAQALDGLLDILEEERVSYEALMDAVLREQAQIVLAIQAVAPASSLS